VKYLRKNSIDQAYIDNKKINLKTPLIPNPKKNVPQHSHTGKVLVDKKIIEEKGGVNDAK